MNPQVFSLEGKVAVVTGGTSGIGLALSLGLADAGADVIATARRQQQVDDTAKEIEARGRKTIRIASDVGDRASMEKLLAASKAQGRREIVVSDLVHKKSGDNPHLWYEPATMKALANRLAADLSAADPAHKADYDQGEAQFLDSLKPLDAKIADMRKTYAGQPVIASEPVFGYQAGLIGLNVHNEKFALAVMNNAEPGASEVAAFESDLKGHKVKAMLYNAQASEPAVGRLVQMAKDNSIPVVGVSETEPPHSTYQQWMLGQLEALDVALGGAAQ